MRNAARRTTGGRRRPVVVPDAARPAGHGLDMLLAILLAALMLVSCAKGLNDPELSGPGDDDPGAGGPGNDGPAPVYQFGAKFEPPIGRVVHALGQWEAYNANYVAAVGASAQPVSQLLFLTLGDTPRGWDPALIAAQVDMIEQKGMIPNIDIALRGLQPLKLDTLSDPLYGIDDEVASGTKYDGRIQDLIEIVRVYGKPVMMRIGGEFSGAWNGYHPYEYPKAFRKIVTMFRQAGVDNVAFIWCYEPAAPGDFAEMNAAGEYRWFPGADVVDWFSVDVFAKADLSGPLTQPGRNETTPYARVLEFLDMAVGFNKPVIIAESAPSGYDLSSAAGADAAWEEWFTPYFELMAERPEIKWFHYINYDWTQAGHYDALGWKNNDLTLSPVLMQRYVAELSKAKYLHADEMSLLKGYNDYQ